jgi:hypothetical protein
MCRTEPAVQSQRDVQHGGDGAARVTLPAHFGSLAIG